MLINKNGLLNRTVLIELYFEEFPNSSVADAESFLAVNGMSAHKTLIQKIRNKKAKNPVVTNKTKPENVDSTIKEKIREIIRQELADALKSEIAKLFN